MAVFDALSYDNVVFRGYITWGGLLIMKMLAMSMLTGVQRTLKGVRSLQVARCVTQFQGKFITFQAFENPEDAGANTELKKNETVERVRRAHLNDLENIPAFLIAAFFYVMSEPQPDVGFWLIRIAVIARILHTIVSHSMVIQ